MKYLKASIYLWSIIKTIPKKNTIRNYKFILTRFTEEFGNKDLEEITSDDILSFLTENTTHTKQNTKRSRYACLKSLFNFIIESSESSFLNPCDTPILRKILKNLQQAAGCLRP